MAEPKLKTISINPDIFSGFGGNANTRKKKPEKPLRIKAPVQKSDKTRKKEILQRIRNNQERQYKTLFDEKEKDKTENVETVFNNSFDESVKFMETVVDNTEKSVFNKTLKNRDTPQSLSMPLNPPMTLSPPMMNPPMSMTGDQHKPQSLLFHEDPMLSKISEPFNILDTIEEPLGNPVGLSPMKIQPQPSYGCLKGGALPTYRNYTMKNNVQVQAQAQAHAPTPINNTVYERESALTPAPRHIVGRIRTPEEVIEMKKLREVNLEAKKNKQKPVHNKIRKLMKRTYRVGRDKYKPTVGVLLPNKTIKNNITSRAFALKQTPIAEVRKYLLKTGFIKIGSAAPNDVLRKIYESIKLIDGDVKNHNPDNLLYNFFNDNAK
jgi:hypothetical protein